jgi:4-hydroxybenzoate polyprenyltransferase
MPCGVRRFSDERFASWSAWKRWGHAAKPASWPKLVVPTLLGQALGVAAGGRSLGALAFGLAFTVLDLAFVVFLNDWGDREVDALKRRMFPHGCSPKTIPDAILPARQLLAAGLAAGAVALMIALAAASPLDRPGLPLAAALALFGFALLSLASALASGLSDERSDRLGGKRTVATLIGNRLTRRLTEAIVVAGIVAWAIAGVASWPSIGGAAVAGYQLMRMRAVSDDAVTDAFAAQGRYKAHLHRAIWGGAIVIAAFEVIRSLWP